MRLSKHKIIFCCESETLQISGVLGWEGMARARSKSAHVGSLILHLAVIAACPVVSAHAGSSKAQAADVSQLGMRDARRADGPGDYRWSSIRPRSFAFHDAYAPASTGLSEQDSAAHTKDASASAKKRSRRLHGFERREVICSGEHAGAAAERGVTSIYAPPTRLRETGRIISLPRQAPSGEDCRVLPRRKADQ